jgi:hypothetical protein
MSPSSLYNVGGKMMLSTMLFNAQDYIARVHDLSGVINLVRLQILVASTDKPANETVEGSMLKQPYNGQPMIYNRESNTLEFECLNKGSVCQVRIE